MEKETPDAISTGFEIKPEYADQLLGTMIDQSPITRLMKKIKEGERNPRFWLRKDPEKFYTIIGRFRAAWEVLRGRAYPEPF